MAALAGTSLAAHWYWAGLHSLTLEDLHGECLWEPMDANTQALLLTLHAGDGQTQRRSKRHRKMHRVYWGGKSKLPLPLNLFSFEASRWLHRP
eukprot:51843-Amphidinium_carterae.1